MRGTGFEPHKAVQIERKSCGEQDLNLRSTKHTALNRARLTAPASPRRKNQREGVKKGLQSLSKIDY